MSNSIYYGISILGLIFIILIIIIVYSCKRTTERYKNFNGRPIYITLTTIPDRINNIIPILKSLEKQTPRPTKIFINIPQQSKRFGNTYLIPQKLTKFINKSKITKILRTQDYGPATKLLGSLDHVPSNALNIICDDDYTIKNGMIKELVGKHMKHPNSIITGQKGPQGISIPGPDIPFGSSGVLFPRELINKQDILEKHKYWEKDCMWVDDFFWYKYFEQLKGIPIISLNKWFHDKSINGNIRPLDFEIGELSKDTNQQKCSKAAPDKNWLKTN